MSNLRKEILLNKARLTDKKKRFTELELRADSYISFIRDIIDPYGGHFTEFDMEKALVIMNDFYNLWIEAKRLKTEIIKLEKDLSG